MHPNNKQVQDPRDVDPFYLEATAETPEQRAALIEEMYAEHLKEQSMKEKPSENKPGK